MERFYIRDITNPPMGYSNILGDIHSIISLNDNNSEIPGINTSMHYIGMENSYTSMHEEDGGLSSINILKDGVKIWIVVHYRFRAELKDKVFQAIKKKNGTECLHVMKHKNLLVTPALLDEWDIPYTIVTQKKGDMFFIRAGAYHAVINSTRNIAEAINFGCNHWNGSYEPFVCNCNDSYKVNVYQDKTIVTTYEKAKQLHSCYKCSEVFVTQTKLRLHIKTLHEINFKYECQYRSKKFVHLYHLNRHVKTHTKPRSKCQICNEQVVRLSEHMRNAHLKRKTCGFCGKDLAATSYEKHIKLCQNKGNVICMICDRKFSQPRYLTQHQKQKHQVMIETQ
ncbi:hypothetical protein TKK_0003384 [Trichogramma kaykai]